MQVRCDKCSGSTKLVHIPYKDKSRGTFVKYECQSGCMNGRYKYTCFAPKDGPFPMRPPAPNDLPPKQETEILKELRIQSDLLRNIFNRLKGANDMYTGEDLQPDENVPF